jgi:hypothetical protein
MTETKCKIYEHIFIINDEEKLECQTCKITYNAYLADVESHKFEYRRNLKHI